MAGQGSGAAPVHPRADHRSHRAADVRRVPGDSRRGDRRAGSGGCQRRIHSRPAHHAGRPGRVRRHGRAAAAGTRGLPVRLRGAHAARAPGPGAAKGGNIATIPLTVLDLVPVSAGSTAAEALRNSINLAQAAERFGYSRYWFAEHHLNPGVAGTSPAVVLALTAAATSTRSPRTTPSRSATFSPCSAAPTGRPRASRRTSSRGRPGTGRGGAWAAPAAL